MNQSDNEQRRRRIRSRLPRAQPSCGCGLDGCRAGDVDRGAPFLVKHVVFQVAVQFPCHVDRDELVAGARHREAARRYDEARGVPFERFAAQRIRGAILDAVRARRPAPIPTNARRQLEQAEQQLAAELGRMLDRNERGHHMRRDDPRPTSTEVGRRRANLTTRRHTRARRISRWSTCSTRTRSNLPPSLSCANSTAICATPSASARSSPSGRRFVPQGRTSQELADFRGDGGRIPNSEARRC